MSTEVKQSVSLNWISPDALLWIERCGRIAYKSQDKITKDSAKTFVNGLIRRAHESVLEHACISFTIVTDRAVANELTRHRLASFTQESTRYVKQASGEVQMKYIVPEGKTDQELAIFRTLMDTMEDTYKYYSGIGWKAEEARDLLPLCAGTELAMTCNLRELRHVLKLRTAKAAHPKMRTLANMILDILIANLPVLVEDIPHA